MCIRRGILFVALAVIWIPASASADIVFFLNDQTGFASAVAGSTLIGIEEFEENTAAAPEDLNDSLTQGVPNGSFVAGLIAPMTVQTNIDGGTTTGANPRGGPTALAVVPGGFGFGNATDVVVSNDFADSTDFIFQSAGMISGVGFNTHTFFGGNTVDVQVFDLDGILLGTQTVGADSGGSNFLGISTNGGDLIGRINIFDPAGGSETGDSVQLFSATVPEPGSVIFLLAGGLLCLGAGRSRST